MVEIAVNGTEDFVCQVEETVILCRPVLKAQGKWDTPSRDPNRVP
jgi:hypothetical protein